MNTARSPVKDGGRSAASSSVAKQDGAAGAPRSTHTASMSPQMLSAQLSA
jgi:hypothetical protein